MLRLKKSLFIFTVVMVSTLVFFGCERRGTPNPNNDPHVSITTYAGEAIEDSLSADPSVFQQIIRWDSYDDDGVVEGYAYRIVHEIDENNDEYLSTPGHSYIESQDGWVYHYAEGANESIPMDNDNALITVWTDDVFAVINFPANIDGDSTNVISRFDLKCIDNSGNESEPVSKYYNVYSYQPGVSILSTSGDIAGEKVGTGIILKFSILNHNPYVDVVPDYFEFKLYTKNNVTGLIIAQPGSEDWISTKSVNNLTNNISQYVLTNTDVTYPRIIPNDIQGTVALDSTYIVARTVDVAGIYSKADTISILVSEEFFPGTVLFDGFEPNGSLNPSFSDTWVLGANHYVTYLSGSIGQVIPNVNTIDGVHFSTAFWVDENQKFSAINSSDLNIHIHWTWKGNYTSDNPNEKLNGDVKDEMSNVNYYSDIIAFDLRLDGEAFNYPPLPAVYFNITDEDGKEWLRVGKHLGLDIFENVVLYSLDSGDHRFEVRAVDLQLKVDPTPSTLEFTLVDPIPQDQKMGILILDDDSNDPNFSPDLIVDSLYYNYFLADYLENNGIDSDVEYDENHVDYIKVVDRVLYHGMNKDLHFGTSKFAPTDLQKYKLIIYHSDRASEDTNFYGEYDALNIYLKTGGNIIFSGCNSLVTLQDKFYTDGHMILNDYFGIPNLDPYEYDVINYLTTSFGTTAEIKRMQLLQYAAPDNSFSQTMHLSTDIFNLFQQMFGNGGLGTLAYFNEDILIEGSEVIYRLGCRDAGDGPLDISDAEYDLYNGQPVGLKKITGESKCYLFGVPLSYLDKEDVKAMLNQIITEVGL